MPGSLVVEAHRANIQVSGCGDMAGDPIFTPLLFGLGVLVGQGFLCGRRGSQADDERGKREWREDPHGRRILRLYRRGG